MKPKVAASYFEEVESRETIDVASLALALGIDYQEIESRTHAAGKCILETLQEVLLPIATDEDLEEKSNELAKGYSRFAEGDLYLSDQLLLYYQFGGGAQIKSHFPNLSEAAIISSIKTVQVLKARAGYDALGDVIKKRQGESDREENTRVINGVQAELNTKFATSFATLGAHNEGLFRQTIDDLSGEVKKVARQKKGGKDIDSIYWESLDAVEADFPPTIVVFIGFERGKTLSKFIDPELEPALSDGIRKKLLESFDRLLLLDSISADVKTFAWISDIITEAFKKNGQSRHDGYVADICPLITNWCKSRQEQLRDLNSPVRHAFINFFNGMERVPSVLHGYLEPEVTTEAATTKSKVETVTAPYNKKLAAELFPEENRPETPYPEQHQSELAIVIEKVLELYDQKQLASVHAARHMKGGVAGEDAVAKGQRALDLGLMDYAEALYPQIKKIVHDNFPDPNKIALYVTPQAVNQLMESGKAAGNAFYVQFVLYGLQLFHRLTYVTELEKFSKQVELVPEGTSPLRIIESKLPELAQECPLGSDVYAARCRDRVSSAFQRMWKKVDIPEDDKPQALSGIMVGQWDSFVQHWQPEHLFVTVDLEHDLGRLSEENQEKFAKPESLIGLENQSLSYWLTRPNMHFVRGQQKKGYESVQSSLQEPFAYPVWIRWMSQDHVQQLLSDKKSETYKAFHLFWNTDGKSVLPGELRKLIPTKKISPAVEQKRKPESNLASIMPDIESQAETTLEIADLDTEKATEVEFSIAHTGFGEKAETKTCFNHKRPLQAGENQLLIAPKYDAHPGIYTVVATIHQEGEKPVKEQQKFEIAHPAPEIPEGEAFYRMVESGQLPKNGSLPLYMKAWDVNLNAKGRVNYNNGQPVVLSEDEDAIHLPENLSCDNPKRTYHFQFFHPHGEIVERTYDRSRANEVFERELIESLPDSMELEVEAGGNGKLKAKPEFTSHHQLPARFGEIACQIVMEPKVDITDFEWTQRKTKARPYIPPNKIEVFRQQLLDQRNKERTEKIRTEFATDMLPLEGEEKLQEGSKLWLDTEKWDMDRFFILVKEKLTQASAKFSLTANISNNQTNSYIITYSDRENGIEHMIEINIAGEVTATVPSDGWEIPGELITDVALGCVMRCARRVQAEAFCIRFAPEETAGDTLPEKPGEPQKSPYERAREKLDRGELELIRFKMGHSDVNAPDSYKIISVKDEADLKHLISTRRRGELLLATHDIHKLECRKTTFDPEAPLDVEKKDHVYELLRKPRIRQILIDRMRKTMDPSFDTRRTPFKSGSPWRDICREVFPADGVTKRAADLTSSADELIEKAEAKGLQCSYIFYSLLEPREILKVKAPTVEATPQ